MFKYAKFTLLILVAFLLLGFSITANAAKPDKDHVLTTPPVRGVLVTCNASNLTEVDLDVYFDLPNQDGDFKEGWSTIPAGEVVGWTQHNNMMTSWTYCTLSWHGQKDDVEGTICLHEPVVPFPPYTCLSAD